MAAACSALMIALILLFLALHTWKLTATGISELYNVHSKLPLALRQMRKTRKNVSDCRQEKITFVKGQSIPEFIHIPKNAGGFIEHLGQRRVLAANGTKLRMHWGRFHDWPKEEDYPNDTWEVMLKDDTWHCSYWHRPPKFWWQTPRDLQVQVPYTSRSFCVVRNPYSRLISQLNWSKLNHFNRKKLHGESTDGMSKCVEIKHIDKTIIRTLQTHYISWQGDCHFLPQSEYVFDIDGCRICDDILLFEELGDQLKFLLQTYGFRYQESAFENLHASHCKDINFLDLPSKILQIVNKRYKDDFINFRYEMIDPNKSNIELRMLKKHMVTS